MNGPLLSPDLIERASRHIVFDLDGTLVDSAPTLGWAMNLALQHHGRRPLHPDEVRSCIGHGLDAFVHKAAGLLDLPRSESRWESRWESMWESMWDDVRIRFFQNLAESPCKNATVRCGARSLMESLHTSGARIGVCTNKSEHLARAVLDGLGLLPFTQSLVGGDTVKRRKPAPDPLLRCLAELGGEPGTGLFVGDSAVDVATARAAGCPIVIVRGGYEQASIDHLGADAVIDELESLRVAIFETPPTKSSKQSIAALDRTEST